MAFILRETTFRWQVGAFFLVLLVDCAVCQIRYSVPEEMRKGSFVGNIAEDLGVEAKRLKLGGARIVSEDSSEYIRLDADKGVLVVGERIDREQLCGQTSPCSLNFEMIMTNPMQLHSVVVEVLDVNDNAPVFHEKEVHVEIVESALLGTEILQESATDPDVGVNGLQGYTLHPTTHFNIKVLSSPNGNKYAQLYLSSALDREREEKLLLTLTAVDGGEPQKSGALKVHVTVVDTNDNAPVFTQSNYKGSVKENSPKGTRVLSLTATDADKGMNGRVTYHFNRMSGNVAETFHLDENSGDLTVNGLIDYEENRVYEIGVQAKDQGGQSTSTKVIIEVTDVNDNAPVITLTSFANVIAEDSPSGTTVAIINVKDLDSGNNGKVDCSVSGNIPFAIQTSLKNYYTLVTNGVLDRERHPFYNITFTAVDEGKPPLATNKTITLRVSDVNDNAPVFEQDRYEAAIMENNAAGVSLFSIKAQDSDSGQNARVSYLLVDTEVNGNPISTYISVNAESGVLHAVRSFDYEQIKTLNILVKGQDGGSPPLSSNTSIKLNIQDQNDNPPQVLYPVQTGGSVVYEMVPRSADVGYLVTKVVAVDVDSGQNAWLSYKLQKATDRALFEVGLQNGEIRTIRQVSDKDPVKQILTVIVEDNGQPSRSATVTVTVGVADSFPEALSEMSDFAQDKEYDDNLTFYLVLALAVVSFLFITCVVVIISVKIYRWRQSRVLYHSNLPVIPYYPPRYSDTLGTGTLQHVYNYEVCRTTDSRKSDCKFGRAGSQNVLIMDPSSTGTMQRLQSEKSILDEPDSPLEICVLQDVVKYIFTFWISDFTIQTMGIIQLQRGKWQLYGVIPWQVLIFLLVLSANNAQIRYSVPEEMKRGSLVGNVAQDLGLDLNRLRTGRARIVLGENNKYTELLTDKGILVVNERIDREELCGEVTPCSFSFEIILENPIEIHRVTVEILDVNDNSPTFKNNVITLEISESATVGSRFDLESAYDPDAGIYTLQQYILSRNDHFVLKQHSNAEGIKFAVMILQKPLDREVSPHLSLKLIAVDGGTPQRSGTVNIEITVLDANDNPPIFNQSVYSATVTENAPIGTYIATVNASDADSGSNGVVTYSFSNLKGKSGVKFSIDSSSGKITVADNIDFEKDKKFEIRVIAKDQGGLNDAAKVVIEVTDVNDNAPVINIMSFSSPISEDVPPDTTIAVFNVKDADSERNGQITCLIDSRLPFKIRSSLTNYYNLLSDHAFDRETRAEYNITVTATDSGSPPLSTQITLHLKISDVNDNAPVFTKPYYYAHVVENNVPALSIFTVSALDIDFSQNARISFFLDDMQVGGSPVSSYVSINSETGVIHAMRSFDYEQIKQLVFSVKAQDGGSPPLSSNVTVKILVQDQNDNPPQVLYPVQTGGSVVYEMVPRSADVGYLVTKVVAVDVDSGQNAWLSYKLQKATDRALFEVGLQNGEIRTIRQVSDKDPVKQILTVIVEDNGQPSRSATVTVTVGVADSFPEALSEMSDFAQDKEYDDNLTFYLVLALAVVSFLFITCVVVIISVKIYRWRQSRVLYHSNLPVIPYYPPRYSDTLGTGTLQHVYNYEVCRTTDSRKSDCKFGRAGSQNVLIMDPSSTGTMQRLQNEKSILDEPDSPLEVRFI
ncbi:uncharacterized protein LOC142901694 [Nelusetta ayraudi]|uniref:uncharacterized protein LOC142901694 n=1 Tax=Nelusetta ayraudi TaxID=303726 RepID=UPI003F706180